MAKTFILGVGAQRTGSTWLHSQLKKNPQVNMGFCKEYHVFDVLFSSHCSDQKSHLFQKFKQLKIEGLKKELRQLSFIKNPEKYFAYFDRLYDQNKRIEAVGDMTPSYSMLDAEAYQFIRDRLEQHGFHAKVIFIMRDPVERIWSMFHQATKVKKAMQSNEIRQASIATFTNPHASLRTRYDRTITELEMVFPTQDIFYGFYETLFSSESYAALGRFLGVELKEPKFSMIKNSSLMKGPLHQELAKNAAKYYAPTYDFVLKKFGEQMRDLWPGFKHLDCLLESDSQPS